MSAAWAYRSFQGWRRTLVLASSACTKASRPVHAVSAAGRLRELGVENDALGLGHRAPHPDLPARVVGEDVGRGELEPVPAVVGCRFWGSRLAAAAGPPSRSRRAPRRSPPPSPRSCPRPWPTRRRGRRPGRRPPRARTPSRRPPASAWARPDVREQHDLGAGPLQRADDRLGQPQLDERAVGHHHDRPVGIADRRRIGSDLAHPAAPEGDLWEPSDGECADVRGDILPGLTSTLPRQYRSSTRIAASASRAGAGRRMREAAQVAPAAPDLEAAVAEQKDQRHAGNEAADVRPERDAGSSRSAVSPLSNWNTNQNPSTQPAESGASRECRRG